MKRLVPGTKRFIRVVVMPTTEIRDTLLAWDRSGRTGGRPVVWGHGLTSSRLGEDDFPLVDLEQVREHHDVVRYDARGHGESAMLTNAERGSWAELALDQRALVDHLGIDDLVLGGVSMGVGTALHSALGLGERVHKLVLVIPPTAWGERAAQVAQYDQMASIVEAKGVEPLVTASSAIAPPDPFAGSDVWSERRAAALRAADPVRLAAIFRGAGHADLPLAKDLSAIVAPTLVLAWSGDPGHPVSTAERLGEVLPNVDVTIASTVAEFEMWTNQVVNFLAP